MEPCMTPEVPGFGSRVPTSFASLARGMRAAKPPGSSVCRVDDVGGAIRLFRPLADRSPPAGVLPTEVYVTRTALPRIADRPRPPRAIARVASASRPGRATTRGSMDVVANAARRRASRPGGFGCSERAVAGRPPARTRQRDATERRIGTPPGPFR
jgi:hypothetical protein